MTTVSIEYKNHLFYSYKQHQKKQYCPRGVLVGCVGTGKTTFFNKITNQNQFTSDGISSATRSSFSCNSAYGDRFMILDTPGTQAEQDKLLHALALRSALIEGSINRIFLLVKFDRIGAMLKNMQEQLFALSKWANIITIVVTHWDKNDNYQNRKVFNESIQRILENGFDLENSFIFVGEQSDPQQLCQAVYRSLNQNDAINLEIGFKQFKFKFDIYENISKYILEQKELFKIVEQNILESMAQYKEDDKDEFLHACIANISEIGREIIEEFEKKHGKNMNVIQCYTHYLELKQHFIPIVENIRKVASQSMSYSLLDLKDPRNKFKKCPHCGIIWLKVEGCNGNTTCGNRVFGKDIYLNSKYFMKYLYDFRALKWIKQTFNKSNLGNYEQIGNGVGCGKVINWETAPIISNEFLKQLKDVGIDDIMVDHKETQYASFNQNLQIQSQIIKVIQL
ncbi:hypothetical protein ABPG74_017062 [Tetrahymena malaccensis]